MHNRHRTLQDVTKFVAEERGMDASEIAPTTRLGEDLGIDGADAVELLDEFASRFHVDLRAMEFARHFGPEAGGNPVSAAVVLAAAVLGRSLLDPITVADLAQAAERGVWSYER